MTTKKRMLVDASHPEETRIVVSSANKLDEFDFESAARRQLRGNIYLAKVTRVEPSLQAAFVEYGGNRHGFLAFSEIHPDYYQIPLADRQALLEAEAEATRLEEELAAKAEIAKAKAKKSKAAKAKAAKAADAKKAESVSQEADLSDDEAEEATDNNAEVAAEEDSAIASTETQDASESDESEPENADQENAEPENGEDENFDDLGGGEGEDLLETRRKQFRRYKIQEVIKRGQVLLIQVVKEERGNKGAALTTYLSLAGRYSVLMPNTARGGGISRKITSSGDRKRLKQIASDLVVPQGMGVILRTAGASRTKAEIKRDFEYLSRLWENVRQLTMKSTAPSLVYEEGSLIKRTIRDLYTKEISEVLVSGDQAYREAKDFMQLIMPSHAKNVKQHKESQNLFSRYNVESQLDAMFSPQVTLPSGGYIVINPTEALVSIDVNSGRATKEHNIEATAMQTNLEAAEECARQFRLRDLAGLIVIDFIDMNERRSTRAVEKRLKDALKNDRARIQIGRISHFGLLEMSRQRMRAGVLESSTNTCPTCEGTGIIRAAESRALMVMRAIEDHVVRKPGNSINVKAPVEVALYLLNAKRGSLLSLEAAQKLTITIEADGSKTASEFVIERGESRREIVQNPVTAASIDPGSLRQDDANQEQEERPQRKRRRRNSGAQADDNAQKSEDGEANDNEVTAAAPSSSAEGEQDDQPKKRRRRGRRGGRRNRRNAPSEVNGELNGAGTDETNQSLAPEAAPDAQQPPMPVAPAKSEPATQSAAEQPTQSVSEATNEKPEKPKKPARRRAKKSQDTTKTAETSSSKATDETSKNAKSDDDASTNGADAKSKTEPPKTKKPLPEEGVIVTSSSDKSEEKTKKKGWWARW